MRPGKDTGFSFASQLTNCTSGTPVKVKVSGVSTWAHAPAGIHKAHTMRLDLRELELLRHKLKEKKNTQHGAIKGSEWELQKVLTWTTGVERMSLLMADKTKSTWRHGALG